MMNYTKYKLHNFVCLIFTEISSFILLKSLNSKISFKNIPRQVLLPFVKQLKEKALKSRTIPNDQHNNTFEPIIYSDLHECNLTTTSLVLSQLTKSSRNEWMFRIFFQPKPKILNLLRIVQTTHSALDV